MPAENHNPARLKSHTEQALLSKLRFSLLLLAVRKNDDSIDRVTLRCRDLERQLNHYQPSAWFLRTFQNVTTTYCGMLLNVVEDNNGWHVIPMRSLEHSLINKEAIA